MTGNCTTRTARGLLRGWRSHCRTHLRTTPASVGAVKPSEALDELTTLSAQIEDAALLGESGFVLASTGTPERGEQLARVAADLLSAAADVRAGGEVTRVEVRQQEGSVFVVVEAGRTAVATTVPEPTAGLVLYDLRTALRRLEEAPAPKPRRKRSTSA
jgi:predicted regulator of Ras-like GTPase activity (Roadblock/LC7/MglB family)